MKRLVTGDSLHPKSVAQELQYDEMMSVAFKGLDQTQLSDWSEEVDDQPNTPRKFLEYSQHELEELKRGTVGAQSTPKSPKPKSMIGTGTNIPKFNHPSRTKSLKRNEITPPGSSQDTKKTKVPQDV